MPGARLPTCGLHCPVLCRSNVQEAPLSSLRLPVATLRPSGAERGRVDPRLIGIYPSASRRTERGRWRPPGLAPCRLRQWSRFAGSSDEAARQNRGLSQRATTKLLVIAAPKSAVRTRTLASPGTGSSALEAGRQKRPPRCPHSSARRFPLAASRLAPFRPHSRFTPELPRESNEGTLTAPSVSSAGSLSLGARARRQRAVGACRAVARRQAVRAKQAWPTPPLCGKGRVIGRPCRVPDAQVLSYAHSSQA